MLLVYAFVGFVLVIVVLLLFFQRSLIYFPRSYDSIHRTIAAQAGTEIDFTTDDGTQTMFYVPARANGDGVPPRLWVIFGGNASLALDWIEFVEQYPRDDTAFLLVDYPGYGWSEGRPSRKGIVRSAEASLPALAAHLGVEEDAFEGRLGVIGHSLGAAAALEFAVRRPVRHAVLISPFTSLRDMAHRAVGWPLRELVYDRFDNRARLAELFDGRAPGVRVDLFHGASDDIVPSSMSEELAELFPEGTELHLIRGGDHNWLLDSARSRIHAAMAEEADEFAVEE